MSESRSLPSDQRPPRARLFCVLSDDDFARYEQLDQLKQFRDFLGWYDEDDDCRLLHFRPHDAFDRLSHKDKTLLYSVRGWIYCKHTLKRLSTGFGYPIEWRDLKDEDEIGRTEPIPASWKVWCSLEGTLLRVFHSKTRWHIATNKKLDAFQSRWSSKQTFGEQLEQVLSDIMPQSTHTVLEFLQSLDPTHVYAFFIRNGEENRIKCKAPVLVRDKLVYLGRVPLETESFEEWVFPGEDATVAGHAWLGKMAVMTPFEVESAEDSGTRETWESLYQRVNACISPDDFQGVFCLEVPSGKQIKIFSDAYQRAYQLRGVHPNIRFRYLEVRRKPEVNDFVSTYPFYQKMFEQIEQSVEQLAQVLHQCYIQRYIHDEMLNLPNEEFILLKKCHNHYLADRQHNRIYAHVVQEMLDAELPLHLYRMLKRLSNHDHGRAYRHPPSSSYVGRPRPSLLMGGGGRGGRGARNTPWPTSAHTNAPPRGPPPPYENYYRPQQYPRPFPPPPPDHRPPPGPHAPVVTWASIVRDEQPTQVATSSSTF